MHVANCTIIYIDAIGRDALGIGFVPWPDSSQFVGFVRPYAPEPDDKRYRIGEVSIELGLREMERGIFVDALERVWFDGARVRIELGGPLSGEIEIDLDTAASDMARLGHTLELIFDGTGRFVDTSTPYKDRDVAP